MIEYEIFLHGIAQQWRPRKKRIWYKGSLGDEDDAQTSNTCIAQRKRTIPHLMMKNNHNIIECCNNTLQGASLVRMQHQRLHFGPQWRESRYLLFDVEFWLFVIGRVSDPEQVAYGGEVLGESVIESELQIGSKVKHTYDVSI